MPYPNAMWYGYRREFKVAMLDPPINGAHSSNVTMLKYFLDYSFS
jgi:hypothetical protein